jgi:hypothetical protein
VWAAAVVAVMWLVSCSSGDSLPTGQGEGPGPTTSPDGQVPLPNSPAPAPGTGITPAPQSLWPLTPGSTWTYRITDDMRGVFEKRVEVLGPQTVPDTEMTAIAVRSLQPHLEERSWQLPLGGGLVVRLREEDLKSGEIARVMTWAPATVKALSTVQELNWTHSATTREVTRLGDGTVEEKERTYVWRVLGMNETVTVPAGTFTNAIRIRRDRPDKEGSERIYWLVPGIGKVKEEGERLEELVSYDIKK